MKMVSRRSSFSGTTSGVSSDTLSFGDKPQPQNVIRLKPAIGSVFSALQPACALRRAFDRWDTVPADYRSDAVCFAGRLIVGSSLSLLRKFLDAARHMEFFVTSFRHFVKRLNPSFVLPARPQELPCPTNQPHSLYTLHIDVLNQLCHLVVTCRIGRLYKQSKCSESVY